MLAEGLAMGAGDLAQGTVVPEWHILWEECLKSNLEKLSNSMSLANITGLAVAKDRC